MSPKDKISPDYQKLVAKLPKGYENCYHFLIQYGVVFIVLSLFGRRAREGIDFLTKSHFQKKYDEENNYSYWKKVLGETSKNYQ